jgi:small subunit ribosomal protein S4e
MIVIQRLVKVDGKVRTDMFYLTNFQDGVKIEKAKGVKIEKAKESFHLLYDTKGHIVLHRVVKEEATYKLCLVKKVLRGPKGVP